MGILEVMAEVSLRRLYGDEVFTDSRRPYHSSQTINNRYRWNDGLRSFLKRDDYTAGQLLCG